ncbi:MAG: four-helix bundle copper-binding protein [Halobacteriovoraceae bacterium]|nr:four-helix bundle copper-binding protein [Halobacteriovoraceae bacterium]|tara:strand:+ start:250768 stop:251157 length:390 start_codon:yes stop_codon:yes gene_type:complete
MQEIDEMLKTHPMSDQAKKVQNLMAKAVLCSTTCYTCADACLSQQETNKLTDCIRINLDCATICEATTQILARPASYNTSFAKKMIEACKEVCRACAEECEKHANMHEHCKICAQSCRTCVKACQEFLN